MSRVFLLQLYKPYQAVGPWDPVITQPVLRQSVEYFVGSVQCSRASISFLTLTFGGKNKPKQSGSPGHVHDWKCDSARAIALEHQGARVVFVVWRESDRGGGGAEVPSGSKKKQPSYFLHLEANFSECLRASLIPRERKHHHVKKHVNTFTEPPRPRVR